MLRTHSPRAYFIGTNHPNMQGQPQSFIFFFFFFTNRYVVWAGLTPAGPAQLVGQRVLADPGWPQLG